jgi:hypothetical protein
MTLLMTIETLNVFLRSPFTSTLRSICVEGNVLLVFLGLGARFHDASIVFVCEEICIYLLVFGNLLM